MRLPKIVEEAVFRLVGYEVVSIETEECEEQVSEQVIENKITLKMLKDIEDEWVKRYIIN